MSAEPSVAFVDPRDPQTAVAMPSASRETLQAVAEAFDLTVAELRGAARTHPLVHARQVAMGLLYCGPLRIDGARPSLMWIGRRLNRDHTTILNGVNRYRAWCLEAGLSPTFFDLKRQVTALASHLGRKAAQATVAADPAEDPAFLVFAQTRLRAEANARLVVGDAWWAFAAFCERRRAQALSVGAFGRALETLAGRGGGSAEGGVVTGLSMDGGR